MENAEGQFTFVVGSGYELKTSQYPQHQTDTVEDGSVLKAQREVHLIMWSTSIAWTTASGPRVLSLGGGVDVWTLATVIAIAS